MLKKVILLFISLLFISYSFSFKTIDLNNYKKIKNVLLKNKEKLQNNHKVNNLIKYLCKQDCSYFHSSDDVYYFKPSCFSNFCKWSSDRKFLDFKDAVDTAWNMISWFDHIYDLNSTKFVYTFAKPKFYIDYNLDNFIWKTKIDDLLLSILQVSNYYIKVPKIFLVYENLKNYSFYVSDKNLKKRNKSRLNNFYIAMKQIDKYFLEPWKEIYFNKLVAYIPWYEKKNPKSNYAFYGWVCGVSTMLFRNSLINPYLYVVKRYNHSQRYVNFYSNYIYWDDGAVYEFIKTFKVKNISNYPIYFRKKQIWKELYFVSIVPKKSNQFSMVEKRQTWKLSAYVKKSVYDKNWFLKYYQDWVSNYVRKNYEK